MQLTYTPMFNLLLYEYRAAIIARLLKKPKLHSHTHYAPFSQRISREPSVAPPFPMIKVAALQAAAPSTFFFFCSTFNNSARLMCGSTPPKAIVALIKVSSSSSPRMASCKWRGVIRLTLRSLAALPASSRTSAVRYSSTAVTYTAAV